MPETTRDRLERLRVQLDADRQTFMGQWRDLGDFILPTRPRFMMQRGNKGDRRNQKIIDCTPSFSARILRSGMMGGLSNPARPWIRLTHGDPKIAASAKVWLNDTTRDMLSVFARSNLYNVLPVLYGDCAVFGTAAAFVVEDDRDVIRGYPLPIGSYYLAASARGDVDTLIRDVPMTVRQVVMEFGLDNVSRRVRDMWSRGDYEHWIDVVHCVGPSFIASDSTELTDTRVSNKPFTSWYYERTSDEKDRFLQVGGFDDFPVLAPRWEVSGEDVYGTMCPGMEAIGDVKALQTLQKRKSQAVEKMVNPPMTGPASLRSQKATILPGDITYLDVRDGQNGFRPAHEVHLSVAEVSADISEHQYRIRRAFFEDLFLMVSQDDKTHRTATEIMSREQEKLIVLGPVLERFNSDLFGPLVDIAFNRMRKRGLIRQAPEEIEEQPLKVEYVSILAQAQKAVSTGSMERFAGYVGQMAAVNTDALDKFDIDESIDEYADMTGVPPSVVRSDEVVEAIRRRRANEQAQAQRSMAIQQASQTAKNLSQADLEGTNALTALTGRAA